MAIVFLLIPMLMIKEKSLSVRHKLNVDRRAKWEETQDKEYIKNLMKKQGLRMPKSSNIVPKKIYQPSQNSFKYNGFGINGAFSINSSRRYNPLTAIPLTYKQKKLNERVDKFRARLDERSEGGHIKAECVEDLMREFSVGNGFTDLFGESDFSYMHDFSAGADFPDLRQTSTIILAPSNSVDTSRADRVMTGTDDDIVIQWANDRLSAHGGKITILDGDVYINTRVSVSSNVWFDGQGYSTIIHGVEDGTNDALFRIDGAVAKTNIKFSNIKFDCNGLTNYRDIIETFNATTVTYLYFDHLFMDYPRIGIHIKAAQKIFITNCEFTNGQFYVIATSSSPAEDIHISGIYMNNCDVGTLLTLQTVKKLTIENVLAIDCQEQVIDISGHAGTAENCTDVNINNVIAINCGALLLSQEYSGVWAENVTVDNCICYAPQLYSAIAGKFKGLTLNNIIIEDTNNRKYMSVTGNHIHMNNIQCLTFGRDSGVHIYGATDDFQALDDIKLCNVYVEGVDAHPGDPAIYGFGEGIRIESTNNGSGLSLTNCEVVGCEAEGFKIDNFDDPIIIGCTSNGNSLAGAGSHDGFLLKDFDNGIIINNRSKGANQDYAMNLTRTGTEGNNIIKNNRLTTGVTGALNYPHDAGNIAYDKFIDFIHEIVDADTDYIRANEDLSAGIPITFTLTLQPDTPRTLSGHFDAHANITAYTLAIVGISAKGETITETFTEADGWDWETNNAFATVTSITMSARTGTGVGDTMDIGMTDVLGLCNSIYSTSDVYKIKKNRVNQTVAGAQANTTYDTYDFSVIGMAGNDDITIWYKKNLNIIT